MLTKYAIDYVLSPHHRSRSCTHFTDEPVEAEDFLMHLLTAGVRVTAIRHEGAALTGHAFDRMLKIAAERIAAQLLRESLQIDAGEVKHRFGFAA